MESALSKVGGDEFVGLVLGLSGILCLGIIIVSGIIVPHWRRSRHIEAEMRLKQEMVAAGFSSDEIERVVQVSSDAAPVQPKEVRYSRCRR